MMGALAAAIRAMKTPNVWLMGDTVDELVLQRVETKRAVQDLLLDAMKTKGVK